MTGWRVGWACGNATLVGGLGKVEDQHRLRCFDAVQRAAIAALSAIRTAWPAARHLPRSGATSCAAGWPRPGFDVLTPKASFYTLIANPKGVSSIEFASRLLTEAGIVATPATGFGAHGEGYVRLTICADKARLAEAVERLKALKL